MFWDLINFLILFGLLAHDVAGMRCFEGRDSGGDYGATMPCPSNGQDDESRKCCGLYTDMRFNIRSSASKTVQTKMEWTTPDGKEPDSASWTRNGRDYCAKMGRPYEKMEKYSSTSYEYFCGIKPACDHKSHNTDCADVTDTPNKVCMIVSEPSGRFVGLKKCSDFEYKQGIYAKPVSGGMHSLLGDKGKKIGEETKKLVPYVGASETVCAEALYDSTTKKFQTREKAQKYIVCKKAATYPIIDYRRRDYRYESYDDTDKYWGGFMALAMGALFILCCGMVACVSFVCGGLAFYGFSIVFGSFEKTKKTEAVQYPEVNQL